MQAIRVTASALMLMVAGIAGVCPQARATGGMEAKGAPKTSSEPSPPAEGEVRRVDKDGGKVTIKHGPIKTDTLDMDPMTMVFQVKDKALLDSIKAGDKVKFRVVSDAEGRVTLTDIKPSR